MPKQAKPKAESLLAKAKRFVAGPGPGSRQTGQRPKREAPAEPEKIRKRQIDRQIKKAGG